MKKRMTPNEYHVNRAIWLSESDKIEIDKNMDKL